MPKHTKAKRAANRKKKGPDNFSLFKQNKSSAAAKRADELRQVRQGETAKERGQIAKRIIKANKKAKAKRKSK